MTTTFEDIRTAVIAQVKNNLASIDAAWTASANVAWPGVHFPAAGKVSFMAVDIDYHSVRQAAIGSPTRYIEGSVSLSFFAPQGTASADATLAAHLDHAQDLFPLGLSLTIGVAVLRFRAPSPRPPREDDAEFLLGGLECPFYTYA